MSRNKVITCTKKVMPTHCRKGRTITNVETNKATMYRSINAAKIESVRIQKANGGMGAGAVVVLP